MAELEELRNAVLAWAAQKGILAQNALADPGIPKGESTLLPFTDEHAEYFRTRKIVRVQARSLDIGGPKITISSRLVIAKTKREELVRVFNKAFAADNIGLSVGISRPFKVDHTLETYGRFEPIRFVGPEENRRIACGSSVGLGNQRNAGTLTALARSTNEAETGLFGLSCNHVVGGCSTARPGVPIVIPGIQDVSALHPTITVVGHHHATAPMRQGLPSVLHSATVGSNADLACFALTEDGRSQLSSLQGSEGADGYDTPDTFAEAELGMPIKKWGRSTGLTTARISDTIIGGGGRDESVEYNVTSYYGPTKGQKQDFKGRVFYGRVFEVDAEGTPFSLGGDSGALVVTNDSDDERVVGIVVAGSKTKSLVLPVGPMLDALQLKLVRGHNLN